MPITVIHGHDQSGPTTALPGNADAGFLFYDTTINQLFCYTGSAWIAIGSAGNPEPQRLAVFGQSASS